MKISAILLFLLLTMISGEALCQCNGGISVFPYNENFEANSGSWLNGGTSSDWAWGTPSKPVITSAGGGNKCWIIGGLTGSSYHNGELSWLQSPCFDFSSLQNPQISFKIFWETEKKFDGASFEYSTDEGNSWSKLGSVNSAANCLGVNWFNNAAITYLGNTQGWSGNIQPNSGSCLGGSGSGSWLTAKHSLANLAGQPKVIFRFIFGAGTTCNDFDGFAIDDIYIGETPPNSAGFSYTCGSNNLVSFTNASSLCADNFQWNFGDPASGVSNISSAENPSHTFSAPGTYTVSLSVHFPNNATASATKQITVLNAATSSTDVKCWGNANGQATVYVAGGNGNYTYTWNTSPAQTTPTISALIAGTYTVSVTSPGACAITATATVHQPAQLSDTLDIIPEKCGNHNGSVAAHVQGGVLPYNYHWSNGSSASSLQNLTAGNYFLNVTDANGCMLSSVAIVRNDLNQLNLFLGNDTTICPGETLMLNAGSFSSYQWQDGSVANTFAVTQTGNYSVKVTDAEGCFTTDAIHVTVDCSDIYFPTAFTPNHDGLNDEFGPAGNLSIVKHYLLKIYSRWADVIFKTADPYKSWDGKIQGLGTNSGTFIWVAEYELLGKKRIQKGTLTLIR